MRKERSQAKRISGMNEEDISIGRMVEKALGQAGFVPRAGLGSSPQLPGQRRLGGNAILDQRVVGRASRE
jgi:hypothetical protein